MTRAALGVMAGLGLLLGSCSGPPASDAALCRDVINRLCAAPICAEVTSEIPIIADCGTELTTRTGCATEAFMFKAPLDRDTFLTCRVPIIRNGDNITDLPNCDDVADAFTECPLLVSFLGGSP